MKFHTNIFSVSTRTESRDALRDPEKNRGSYKVNNVGDPKNNRDGTSCVEQVNDASHILEICLAEVIGTFMLMFFGCMSIISGFNQTPVPSMQPALAFGFVVSTVIVIFGHISRSHLNPAVTVAALVLGDISWVEAVFYVIAQCIGAVLGYATLGFITPAEILTFGVPENTGICATLPHAAISDVQALLAEFLCTSLLVLTCCGVWDHRNSHHGDAVPIKFAFVVILCSVTVGPYTGASMNPARSLAPAFVNGIWTKQWIYWTAPLLAGVVAPFLYMVLFERMRLERKSQTGPILSN